MKILLVYPPRRSDTYMFPPTSLLYVAQAARQSGHEAEIIDVPYLLEKFPEKYRLMDNSLQDYIISKDCDLLGLGGVVSTYFFYDDFVKQYREKNKNVPIVVGGSVGQPIKDVWEEHNPVDYLVEGDGEIVVQRMLDCLKNNERDSIKKIPGISYLQNGKYVGNPPELIADLDTIPFLNYDELDYEYYIDEVTRWMEDIIPERDIIKENNLRFIPFIFTRGCPFVCTFCFHFNRKHRTHSIDYIIKNIKLFKDKYGINGLMLVDDLFCANKKWTIELCERIHDENLGFSIFGGGGKPSILTLDVLKSMKRAGFIRFSYGIESGSQKMLDVMKKQTTVEQNYMALKNTYEAGIPGTANMVFGMPGENIQTLNETRDFLIKCGLTSGKYYGSWATAYPGTPLFEWMKKEGMVKDTRKYLFEVGSISNYICNFSELPVDKLKNKVFDIEQQVDMAYHLKNKQYKQYLKKCLKRVLGKIYYNLPLFLRRKAKMIKDKITSKHQKRSIKSSNTEIEKWANYISDINFK